MKFRIARNFKTGKHVIQFKTWYFPVWRFYYPKEKIKSSTMYPIEGDSYAEVKEEFSRILQNRQVKKDTFKLSNWENVEED